MSTDMVVWYAGGCGRESTMHTQGWHDTMIAILLQCSHRISEVTEHLDLGAEYATFPRSTPHSVAPFLTELPH
jgi:hypothetical protein